MTLTPSLTLTPTLGVAMVVWAQRRRLPGGVKKELPEELRGLDTQQKAALDKLVHGECYISLDLP